MIVPSQIAPEELVCEEFNSITKRGKLVEWNYRDADGKLHTGICKSVDEAKLKARRFGYQVNVEECVI